MTSNLDAKELGIYRDMVQRLLEHSDTYEAFYKHCEYTIGLDMMVSLLTAWGYGSMGELWDEYVASTK